MSDHVKNGFTRNDIQRLQQYIDKHPNWHFEHNGHETNIDYVDRFIESVVPEIGSWELVNQTWREAQALDLQGLSANPLGKTLRNSYSKIEVLEFISEFHKYPEPAEFINIRNGKLDGVFRRNTRARAESLRNLFHGDFARIPQAARPIEEGLATQSSQICYYLNAVETQIGLFVKDLLRISDREGFRLFATGWEIFEDDRDHQNLQISQILHGGDEWMEDRGHVDSGGVFRMNPQLNEETQKLLHEAARERWKTTGQEYPFNPHGKVRDVRADISYAIAMNAPLRPNLCFLEGGNVLFGIDKNGESYALLGKDSFVMNQALLQRDAEVLGFKKKITRQDVLIAISKDIGVPVDGIILTEQPDYHLDVSICSWTPGVVLVNDSPAAARIQVRAILEKYIGHLDSGDRTGEQADLARRLIAWNDQRDTFNTEELHTVKKDDFEAINEIIEDAKELIHHAAIVDRLERQARQDIENAGLKVVRVPGRFLRYDEWYECFLDSANFLNGEGGVGKDGNCFFITQGADPIYRIAFLGALAEAGVQITRVHFLHRFASARTLSRRGGINCLLKKGPYLQRNSNRPRAQGFRPVRRM